MCQLRRGMEALRQNSRQRKRKDLFICNSWERAMKTVCERQAATTDYLNHFELKSVLGTSETTRDQQQGLCWKHRSHPWGRVGSLHQVSGAKASTPSSSLPLAWGHESWTPWRALVLGCSVTSSWCIALHFPSSDHTVFVIWTWWAYLMLLHSIFLLPDLRFPFHLVKLCLNNTLQLHHQ